MSLSFFSDNAGYILFRMFDLISTAFKVCLTKIFVHRGGVSVPLNFVSGRSLSIRVRRSGKLLIGNMVTARAGLNIFCDGGVVRIGDGVFFNNNCSLNSQKLITICEGTIIGEGVKIYDHDHVVTPDGVEKNKFILGEVKIGRNCWIGSNTVIMKGTTICDNVIIGAGSVITKSISKSGIYVQKRTTSCLQLY